MDAGERESRLSLIEQEIPRLRRFARFLTRDAEYADDLVQECLVRAVDKVSSWQAGTNIRAWLFTILKNVLRNDSRTFGRFVATDPQSEDSDLTGVVPAAQEAHMDLMDVKQAFMQLSAKHREVLLLVALDGLTYEEAAVVLDLPVGTIRSRLARARRDLLARVDGESETVVQRQKPVSTHGQS